MGHYHALEGNIYQWLKWTVVHVVSIYHVYIFISKKCCSILDSGFYVNLCWFQFIETMQLVWNMIFYSNGNISNPIQFSWTIRGLRSRHNRKQSVNSIWIHSSSIHQDVSSLTYWPPRRSLLRSVRPTCPHAYTCPHFLCSWVAVTFIFLWVINMKNWS